MWLVFSHRVCCICVICFRSVVTLGSMGRVYPIQNLIILNNKHLCIYKQEIGSKVIKIINYLVPTCITIKNTNKKIYKTFWPEQHKKKSFNYVIIYIIQRTSTILEYKSYIEKMLNIQYTCTWTSVLEHKFMCI